MSGLTGEQASRSSPRKLPEVGLSPKYQSVTNSQYGVTGAGALIVG